MGFSKFTGYFEHTLDDKGRLIIPSKFRTPLGDRFYIMRSVNAECLWIMPEGDFESFMEKVSNAIPTTDVEGQKWLRALSASVCQCDMDKQGRVVIPQVQRDMASISDPSVTLVGTRERIELWSTPLWKAQEEHDFIGQTRAIFSKYAL